MDDVRLQRERYILRMRYGLDDSTPKSSAQVSRLLGVPEKTIKQYETRGIKKLRHPQRASYLTEFSAAVEGSSVFSKKAARTRGSLEAADALPRAREELPPWGG